jgi:NADH-quinone oxidoreductase subunit M
MNFSLIILTALPATGALATLALGKRSSNAARWTALSFSLVALAFTLLLWSRFDSASGVMQFERRYLWIPAINVEYHVAIDGLGLLMLLLSAIVTIIGILASWHVQQRVPLYFAFVMLLEACLFGTFTTLNFFPFFLFWELSLVPAFFLIKLWGGPNRTHAATQFLVYTMVGSVTMLLTFVALALATHTFDFIQLATLAQNSQLMPLVVSQIAWSHVTPQHVALLLFGGAFLGFAVKVPLFPFHTWLPTTYSEAPSGTTALLTGAMSKMGLYGFLRIMLPIFYPQMRSVVTPLLWLAVATVVFSAYSALAQTDIKRIFAYSSINHLGYCLLAIFSVSGSSSLVAEKSAALNGVLLQMFNHGITAATIFWFISLLERRSGGLRGLNDFGGLRKVIPIFAGLMGITLFSSLGLPGLNGFPGEFLIFKGAFHLTPWATSITVLGLLGTALFILKVLERVFTGPLNPQWSSMPDLSARERLALAPAIALFFILGLYPQIVLGVINQTTMHLVQHIGF